MKLARSLVPALWLVALGVGGIAAAQQPPPPPGAYVATPYLGEVRNEVLFGDIWERPGLSRRDRSLITMAVTQALQVSGEFRLHVDRGLDNGVTQDEIAELVAHVTFYSGFPSGVNASRMAAEVFQQRGLPARPTGSTPRNREPVAPPADPGALQASPYLGTLLNDVVYGELWERPDLSKRDRSLATVAVAQALYATGEIRSHIGRALDNGVTQDEISEIITHVTFYAGFPTGVNAARVAAEVFESRNLVRHEGRYPGAPYLETLLDDVLFGVAWERPELSKRDRSLVTMAVAQTLYATDQIRSHMNRALDNGVTAEEIAEMVAHVTFYSGFPRGVHSSRIAAEVFESRGIPLPQSRGAQDAGASATTGPVFELRTYTTYPGKLDDLDRRFRNHTTRLFERHGMTNVGYWIATDDPLSSNTLIYVLLHGSREAAAQSWAAFRGDPEWIAARTASEANGPIVQGVVSVFMEATDYSKIR